MKDNNGKVIKKYQDKFKEKLKDDFNIPQALALMWDLLKSNEKKENIRKTIFSFDEVLGLKLNSIQKIVKQAFNSEKLLEMKIDQLVNDYEKARQENFFTKSDELRKRIESKGFKVEDTSEGTRVYAKNETV